MASNIYQKMSAITTELETVGKNLEVGYGRSSYKAVGEADVLRTVKPIEAKHGIYSYPYSREIVEQQIITTENDGKTRTIFWLRIKTVYRFINTENPEEFIDMVTYADGMDSADKSTGKAMTYCDKYALLKAYKITTGDDPDQTHSDQIMNGETPKASVEQLQKISELIGSDGDRMMKMLDFYKVSNVQDLTMIQASNAIRTLLRSKP